MKRIVWLYGILLMLTLQGCVTEEESKATQLAKRAYQVKTFSFNRVDASRAVILTLQDLGFVLNSVKGDSIQASLLREGLRVNITLIEMGLKTTDIRLIAFQGYTELKNLQTYQNFFNHLNQVMYSYQQR